MYRFAMRTCGGTLASRWAKVLPPIPTAQRRVNVTRKKNYIRMQQSPQMNSAQSLPPPSRYRKDSHSVSMDEYDLERVRLYTLETRRETAGNETISNRAKCTIPSIADWQSVFREWGTWKHRTNSEKRTSSTHNSCSSL